MSAKNQFLFGNDKNYIFDRDEIVKFKQTVDTEYHNFLMNNPNYPNRDYDKNDELSIKTEFVNLLRLFFKLITKSKEK